jgi:hypothetical protein
MLRSKAKHSVSIIPCCAWKIDPKDSIFALPADALLIQLGFTRTKEKIMSLTELVSRFADTVSQWEAIEPEAHRFGGTEFKLGNVEIGHIHRNNGMVDIPFTVKIREVLVAENLAEPHHLLHESGWITFFVTDEKSLEHGLWLMRLSYLQKRSRRHALDDAELGTMNLSEALKAAAFPRLV